MKTIDALLSFIMVAHMNDELLPGARIDDFTIAFRLTKGMNADVFAVWHHELRAPLICKRLRVADKDDRKWRDLLRLEGLALEKLQHPGIVRLIGQKQKTELPYLLLEYVGDRTLREDLREHGALTLDRAIRIVQHLCAALAHAHERGYLHRDLKPSNIILRSERPVLLDFGVVWPWKTRRKPIDRSGTPQYLSPEQIFRRPLTPATDVYGLGILLYELCTGARPFPTGDLNYHRNVAPESRYPQLARALPPITLAQKGRAPRKLFDIIKRCTAREPSQRFANTIELMEALDVLTRIKIWPRGAMKKGDAPFRL